MRKKWRLKQNYLSPQTVYSGVDNYEIGKHAKPVYNERVKTDEVPSEANRRRTISILVSRHISNVKRMIDNAGVGAFP